MDAAHGLYFNLEDIYHRYRVGYLMVNMAEVCIEDTPVIVLNLSIIFPPSADAPGREEAIQHTVALNQFSASPIDPLQVTHQ